jgi:hypothetical protein
MSLLLFLFYWIGIPVLVISAAFWMWRQAVTPLARGGVVGLCIAVLLGLLWLATGEKWLADRQVRKLCAKDGGVKVYETVLLAPDQFDKYGLLRIPEKRNAKSDDEYYYEFSIDYLRDWGPEVWRSHKQVYRTLDNKLLGESVSYTRRGGDLPGPWAESSFSCPDGASVVDLKKQIFISEN